MCVGDRGALGDHIWVGGGGGFSTFRTNGFDSLLDLKSPCYFSDTVTCDVNGIAFDLRAGYSIGPTAHQLNFSLEALPGFYGTDPGLAIHGGAGRSGSATSIGLMLGYQYL